MKDHVLRKIRLFETAGNSAHKFPDNTVISSRYTLLNFIPKNLFGQFRRVVNFFFLVLIILQFSIDIPVNPIPYVADSDNPGKTPVVTPKLMSTHSDSDIYICKLCDVSDVAFSGLSRPANCANNISFFCWLFKAFAFVIGVTAIKQGYEDWQIHQADNKVNDVLVNAFDSNGNLHKIHSHEIKVGQIICLKDDDSVPSDILLLGCTSENGKSVPQCQITTANLDGEANLKLRFCPSKLSDLSEGEKSFLADMKKASIELEYDEPNTDLYQFMGTLMASTLEKPVPLTMDNVLLRGTRIKNCECVYGCAIYTGRETRLSLNSNITKSNKFSTVERTMNKIVAAVFVMLVILCTVSVLLYLKMRDNTEIANAWYLPTEDGSDLTLGLITFVSFMVLLSYCIPVSLSVTIELQKFGCSKFFVWDNDMRCPKTGAAPICNTSDLNEELGQIEYLFTDKTGTLTENNLSFTCCSINGIKYSYISKDGKSELIPTSNSYSTSDAINIKEVDEFLQYTALCHTVQTIRMENKDSENIQYVASSLDEEALVNAAKSLGFQFLGEEENVLTIKVKGLKVKYTKHLTLDFDAERKCMSIIVENDNGKILVLTKGAESSLLQKCVNNASSLTGATMQHVNDFAKLGLRTLAVACKEITSEELQSYKLKMKLSRRDPDGLKTLFSEIEQDLVILGATGVEDQLQDGVPETLQALKEAGIRIWMLTGDKLETAVNVAISCGFVSSETNSEKSKDNSYWATLSEISDVAALTQKLQSIKVPLSESKDSTLVMDGVSLANGLLGCKDLLCETALSANQVIFCRMAPLQKAQVVRMVKSNKGKSYMTCAVGDGGNDVAMIQEAHIGIVNTNEAILDIGIMGKEGRQATRASDFAVSRFRFLQKAILVHGYWYYQRLATLVVYFFYRGTAFIFQQFLYGFDTVFSAQTIFHSTFVMLYTILLASTPVLVYGLSEQAKSSQELLQNPKLYKELSRNSIMEPKNCIGWVLNTVWHLLLCYYVPWFVFQDNSSLSDWGSYSFFICSLIVAVTDLKIIAETRHFNGFTLLAQGFSYGMFFIIYSLYCQIPHGQAGWLQFSYYPLLSQPEFWLSIFLVATLGLMPDVLVTTFRNFKKGDISGAAKSFKLAKNRVTVAV